MFADYSRVQLQAWIKAGDLTIDGRSVAPKYRVIGGEALRLVTETKPLAVDQPQDVDFRVGFEDEDVLVIDKPAGIVVDNRQRIIVMDFGNHRLQAFSPAGEWLVTFSMGRPATRESEARRRED